MESECRVNFGLGSIRLRYARYNKTKNEAIDTRLLSLADRKAFSFLQEVQSEQFCTALVELELSKRYR